jgi:sulfur-carrier protein
MSITVNLYGSLSLVANVSTTTVEASSIAEVLEELSCQYGESFREKVYDQNGNPRRFINIYVNGKDYRYLKRIETELSSNDEVSLIPAVSGG